MRSETFKAGAHKDLLSPLPGATPEERRIVKSILDSLHARFVSVVREAGPKLDTGRLADRALRRRWCVYANRRRGRNDLPTFGGCV